MTTQIKSNNDLLGYLIQQSLTSPKGWFSFSQQKFTGIILAHSIAANHADKMTPAEVVQYVIDLNNEMHDRMIKKG